MTAWTSGVAASWLVVASVFLSETFALDQSASKFKSLAARCTDSREGDSEDVEVTSEESLPLRGGSRELEYLCCSSRLDDC